jgi:hypothetical protein
MRKESSPSTWRGLFLKPFKNIKQQLDILKDRDLVITNRERTLKYLLSNNYYNIINGYSKLFQVPGSDNYINNVTFDEVASLYTFDKDIKRAILQSILEAEHHIKSITAHRFAESYQNQQYAYLDTKNYDNDKILDVGYIISKLSKIVNYNKNRRGTSINHYYTNHKDVPIWVLTDYLEFGDTRHIIENLPTSLQNKIAKDLVSFIKTNNPNFTGVFPPETMISFLKNINQTRNVCAHNNRLLNYNCSANSVYFAPIHDDFNLQDDDSRKTVYSTVVSLQCFISAEEFNRLWNTLRKKVRKLENKIKSVDINIINATLGFPDDWHRNGPRK